LLARIQVDPKAVQRAIVTHLHWDHVGGYALFPQSHSHSVTDQMNGYTLINRLATTQDLIIPGHDPEVMRRMPICADSVALLE
jgi:metal-dependent hydrolase (beta-lactamase superfamily II)